MMQQQVLYLVDNKAKSLCICIYEMVLCMLHHSWRMKEIGLGGNIIFSKAPSLAPLPPKNPAMDACSVKYLCSALQKEHKVIRLESQAIHTNHSYMLDEMVPDEIVPYLVERRLLSPEKAQDVIGSRLQKASTILQALNEKVMVGTLPTFCASLISAGQPHIARRLDYSENYIACKTSSLMYVAAWCKLDCWKMHIPWQKHMCMCCTFPDHNNL